MSDRLDKVRALNPRFAEAEKRGETWAMQHAQMVLGVDGKADRQHPERASKEDGRPRNWCDDCIHPEGCITCDFSPMPPGMRKSFGSYKTK